MGFFDDLVVEEEPGKEPPRVLELGPPTPESLSDRPPEDWYLPAVLPRRTHAGAGPHARVMLTGLSVWPGAVTLHLVAFLRRMETRGFGFRPERERAGGLRAGLLLGDGLRVTTMDGDPWPPPRGRGRPYTLTSHGGHGGGFRTEVDLLLSALPPEGPLTLVIEWPGQGVPETRTDLDAAEIRAAASEALEIWPGLGTPVPDPDPDPEAGQNTEAEADPDPNAEAGETVSFGLVSAGPDDILAPAPEDLLTGPLRRLFARADPDPDPEPDPHRYDPRPDWDGMPPDGWSDPRLVRVRLDAGADPHWAGEAEDDEGRTLLHYAVERGAPAEVLTELVRHGAQVDAPDEEGVTPLWEAVCESAPEMCETLLAAGADAWRPCMDGWTPGRLALTHPVLAPLFESLPGTVPLTEEERAAQAEADRLIEVFRAVEHTEGAGFAFVAGDSEEDILRKLGSDPATCPVLDLNREPGPHGTGPGGFDPGDHEESQYWVGVTGVEGGCVITQPMGYVPEDARFLKKISPGTVAYGVYFNPKGGTFGTLARDGKEKKHEEIGLRPFEGDPPEFYRFRFWESGENAPHCAAPLAYACAMAGMALTDAAPLTGPPRRWVRIPYKP
ncbi:ankyrin repeat domain-containing protein [Streptomyces sp. NBC_01775]|uniref:ankyrin repeat domain-containing protein n=1 Tax=Streptomyces sp. NBC_01775 TaxID=2975939 RepID=UPI002DDA946D|nr:ankyrin repeat domain-containing protein [Streptomyces sp. NBC_01775]WSB80188.1 ankyrin repeat domain-containing protein [Streptomyces sp. NBC_01775]